MAHIMVVDDMRNVRHVLAMQLRDEGHQVAEAEGVAAAVALLASGVYDLVITDLRMGEVDGLELLREVKRVSPSTEVIVTTAYGTVEAAVRAIQMGALDFLTKPVKPEEMQVAVLKALERRRLGTELARLKGPAAAIFTEARSAAWRELMAKVEKVAVTDSTVLLTGESGVGKEVVAGLIHSSSRRRKAPLLAINLGAVPETLQESELFGHVRGAFTGAVAARKGIFLEADGATLFLDEIGEAAPSTQVAMLRALAQGQVRPVGGDKDFRVDVRVIAATNVDLHEAIAAGRFREDLFFRINVFPIRVPSLRERAEDLPDLAQHLLSRHCARLGRHVPRLEPDALRKLAAYPWPGNVRELENVLERVLILTGGDVIDAADIPLGAPPSSSPEAQSAAAGSRRLADVERAHVLAVLRECGGNKRMAADALGIGRATLFRKLREYGVPDDDAARSVSS